MNGRATFLNYLIPLLIYTVLVMAVIFALQFILPPLFVFTKFYGIVIFFFLISSAFHYGLLYSSRNNDKGFVRFYMAASMIKLLIFLLIIIAYSLIHRSSATPFIATFFFTYILFTFFEVWYLSKTFGPAARAEHKKASDMDSDINSPFN